MISNQIAELIWTLTNDYLNSQLPVEQFTAIIQGIHTGIDAAGMRTEVDTAYRELCCKKHESEAA